MRRLMNTRILFFLACCAVAVAALVMPSSTETASADELTGQALLRIARVAHGGGEYTGLQNVTARSEGFVNMAPFGVAGIGASNPAAGVIELKFALTDFQDKDMRRRLDVKPTGMSVSDTYLVYTGTEGGGKYMGTDFRVSESTASRQWALMGFGALNRAADGQYQVTRQKDANEPDGRYYVVDAKLNSQDTVRYYINQNDFLIRKAVTLYNGKPLVEETRSDFRKVSCMMLPFRTLTKLNGQRVADLAIAEYDISTAVPTATFTLTVAP